ncbi:MAG: hypothetical protein ABI591_30620 [Kofleriaceae bacterium]
MSNRDLELMEHADGEAETELTADGQAKVEAIHEMGELVRGRLELAADDVPDARFAAMWSAIDKQIALGKVELPAPLAAESAGVLSRLGRWLDRYRSQIITGAVSAGAVATLALVLHGGGGAATHTSHDPIDVRPVANAHGGPAEIEALDTPEGTSTVFNLDDEDGSTTVIWVTPEDTVEGI